MKKNKNTCIGSIGKPRGLKGEFFLNSYCSPEKNIINYIDNVRLEDNSRIQLKYIKTNNSKFIAKIEGINDVELVKEYTNEKIYMDDASRFDPGTSPRSGIAGAPSAGSYGNTIYFQATNNGQSPSNAWIQNGTSTRHDISVQAHASNKAKSSYSNYGTPLRTWAPGDYIMSSYINSGSAVQLGATGYYYTKLNGTSMASPQVAGMVATWLGLDPTTYGAVSTKANQESAISFIETYDRTDITDWGGGLTNLTRAYTPHQDYSITWSLGHGNATHNIGSFNDGDNFAYDLSVTFRNAATEQLHPVTYNVTTGALPTNTSINSSGVTSGTIGGYVGNHTPSFTLSATNQFETETKDYTLSVSGTDGLVINGITFTGGVEIN